MNMSPLEINVLLWCYCRPIEYGGPSPEATEAHHRFIRAGLIERDPDDKYWICTESGVKLVDMLCSTPFPIQKWLDPWEIK